MSADTKDPEAQPLIAAPVKEPRQFKGQWYRVAGDYGASDVAACCLAWNAPHVAFGWNTSRGLGMSWWREALKLMLLTCGMFAIVRLALFLLVEGVCHPPHPHPHPDPMHHVHPMDMPGQHGPKPILSGATLNPALRPDTATSNVASTLRGYNTDAVRGAGAVHGTAASDVHTQFTSTENIPADAVSIPASAGSDPASEGAASVNTDLATSDVVPHAAASVSAQTAQTGVQTSAFMTLEPAFQHDDHHDHDHDEDEDDDEDDDDDDDDDKHHHRDHHHRHHFHHDMMMDGPFGPMSEHEARECAERVAPMAAVILSVAMAVFVYAAYYGALRRKMIREKFGIEGTFKHDFLLWLCCAPCALTQETRTLMHNNVEEGLWHGPMQAPAQPVPFAKA